MIERALIYLAPAALLAVMITLAVLEIMQVCAAPSSSGKRRGSNSAGRFPNKTASPSGGTTFRQPPKGSRYTISATTAAWIRPMNKRSYRIYYICGDKPRCALTQDSYGSYFTVRAQTLWQAEAAVRKSYS